LAAPLGQGPLAFDSIGIGGPNLFVFFFFTPALEDLFDLRGSQRDFALAATFTRYCFRDFPGDSKVAEMRPPLPARILRPAGKTALSASTVLTSVKMTGHGRFLDSASGWNNSDLFI